MSLMMSDVFNCFDLILTILKNQGRIFFDLTIYIYFNFIEVRITDNMDEFADTFLKSINSIYEKFRLIKNEGDIYIFSTHDINDPIDIPKSGGDLDRLWRGQLLFIDKSCVKPMSKYWQKKYGNRDIFKNKEKLLAFTVACDCFGDLVNMGY